MQTYYFHIHAYNEFQKILIVRIKIIFIKYIIKELIHYNAYYTLLEIVSGIKKFLYRSE